MSAKSGTECFLGALCFVIALRPAVHSHRSSDGPTSNQRPIRPWRPDQSDESSRPTLDGLCVRTQLCCQLGRWYCSSRLTVGCRSRHQRVPGPVWTQLPAPSVYNTTPSCALNATDYYQCAPSSLPPKDASNPERYLNSAYWPAEKRPDIEIYAVQKYGYDYQNCTAKLPHYCFLLDAQAVGYPVTHMPQAGRSVARSRRVSGLGGSGSSLPGAA